MNDNGEVAVALNDKYNKIVKPLFERICSVCAEAICKYEDISGESDMPEYFLPSMVLNSIGARYPTTLETNSKKLYKWNRDQLRRARCKEVPSEKIPDDYVRRWGHNRVDLVIYEQSDDSSDRNKVNFLALTEFKLWKFCKNDKKKIEGVLKYITTCPFGAMVFLSDKKHWDEFSEYESKARDEKHKFIRGNKIKTKNNTYQAFAWIIPNEAYASN